MRVVTQTDDEVVDQEQASAETQESGSGRLELSINIEDIGPCKKHVRISVPRHEIVSIHDTLVEDYSGKAEVPGFRVGHVPLELVKKRFKSELAEQVKQRVLMSSLEQLNEESELEPINEPNLDLDSIELPEDGDFEYEFDVEVRPTFDLPSYKGLKIERAVREISDEDVYDYYAQFLEQYGTLVPIDAPAEPGDFVTVSLQTSHDGKPLVEIDEISLRVRKVLRFRDAELDGFEEFMSGAVAGDVRETDFPVSMEAESIALRGESVHARFAVLDVKRLQTPTLDDDFLGRIGVESVEDMRKQFRKMLERQTRYEQRQSCRKQVLKSITASADWDLPEDLVSRQVENALRREVLEMQQAGFTSREILARENELRQQSLTMTRQNLKEHFVLDRIADEEDIEVTEADLNAEISVMAMQSGENPRRVRARLVKSGLIENLEAQVREMKAVDVILENAKFQDVPMPTTRSSDVEAVNRSVCRAIASGEDVDLDEDEASED